MLLSRLYSSSPQHENRKLVLLGNIAFLIMSTYWLLRNLRDIIFFKFAFSEVFGWAPYQGRIFQATAKFWSVFIIVAVIVLASYCLDRFTLTRVFYVASCIYAAIFLILALMILIVEVYGLTAIGKLPLAIAGWFSYFAIESFGALFFALFWIFFKSLIRENPHDHSQAMIFVMQLAAIMGSSVILVNSLIARSIWPTMFIATIGILLIIPLITYCVELADARAYPLDHEDKTYYTLPGILQGFKATSSTALISRPYITAFFVILALYEILGQAFDSQLKASADLVYQNAVSFGKFQSFSFLTMNTAAFLISLIGTHYLIRRLGLRFSLLFIYPAITVAIISCLFCFFYFKTSAPPQVLWAILIGYVLVRALGYATHHPVKDALSDLMLFGTMIGYGMVGLWVLVMLYLIYRSQFLVEFIKNKIAEAKES